MARLHEFQGKSLLAQHGLAVPGGGPADSPEAAAAIARSLGVPVAVKMQAWTTGRAGSGGIIFAETPARAAEAAAEILHRRVGEFSVTHVLVEEKLAIARELFLSLFIDEHRRQPALLLSLHGGSGIEGRGQ